MGKVDLGVIGKKTEDRVFEYDWSDVVLYNLGVGASEKDLSFVYEGAPGGLKVLPSFCVVPAMRAFPHLGHDMEWSLMPHGEQIIKLYKPIPPADLQPLRYALCALPINPKSMRQPPRLFFAATGPYPSPVRDAFYPYRRWCPAVLPVWP